MASKATQFRTAEPAAVEQRGALRLAVAISGASVRKLSAQPDDATLRDLSVYGCRIETDGGYATGDRIWIRLSGSLPIGGEVMWATDGLIGCRFDVPIARALLRTVVLSLA
jgi:hypothetical protein